MSLTIRSALLLMLAWPLHVSAQSIASRTSKELGRMALVVVSEDSLVGGARSIIMRDPNREPTDVILIHRDHASAHVIGSAVRYLVKLRAVRGLNENSLRYFRVPESEAGWVRPAEAAEWEKILLGSKVAPIAALGRGKSIQLFLPTSKAKR